LVWTSVGCGKKEGGAAAGPGEPAHVDGTPHTDQVVNAWKGAGFPAEGFAAIDPTAYRAGYCSQGRVGGIDALICEYRDDDSIDRARKLIQDEWGKEGVHTGVALRSKRTLVAVADRGRSDPSGKTINKLLDTFKKL